MDQYKLKSSVDDLLPYEYAPLKKTAFLTTFPIEEAGLAPTDPPVADRLRWGRGQQR